MTVYYAGPQEFNPVNAAYLQLQEEIEESQVLDACDYIRAHFPYGLTCAEMKGVFWDYDIDYPNLPKWLQEKFDEFYIL